MKEFFIPSTVTSFSNNNPFVLIAGPCQVESKEHAMQMCGSLLEISMANNIPFVYKSSFDKANRTSFNSQRGLGGSGYTSGGNGGNMAIASTDGGGNAGGARGSSGSTRNTYGGGGASYGGGGGGSGSGDGGQYPEAGQGGGGAVVIIS